jgi:hypothetical protein
MLVSGGLRCQAGHHWQLPTGEPRAPSKRARRTLTPSSSAPRPATSPSWRNNLLGAEPAPTLPVHVDTRSSQVASMFESVGSPAPCDGPATKQRSPLDETPWIVGSLHFRSPTPILGSTAKTPRSPRKLEGRHPFPRSLALLAPWRLTSLVRSARDLCGALGDPLPTAMPPRAPARTAAPSVPLQRL